MIKFFLFNPYLFTSCWLEKENSIDKTISLNRETLCKEHILFKDDFNYNYVSNFFSNREIYNFNKVTITDALSYSCNLNCKYCMQQNTFKDIHVLDIEKKYELIKEILNFFGANELELCLFGGEPLLFYKEFEKLLNLLISDGVMLTKISVVTNGTLCNNSIIEFINKFNISSLQITLDGTEKIHNSRRVIKDSSKNAYKMSMDNINKILTMTNSTIIINTVLDKSNKNDYLNMVDQLINYFYDYIYSNNPRIIFNLGLECHPVKKSEFTIENILPDDEYQKIYYDIMNDLIDKGVAINSILPSPICIRNLPNDLILSPDGGIYNCISGLGIEEFKIGDYEEIINDPGDFLIKLIQKKQRLDKNCIKCEYFPLCNGGCYYEEIINSKSACQKKIFDNHIYDIINICSKVEEIENNTFRVKK